ncbi:MAG: DUF2764 family protein [Bacteroidales bacterium]|nr:DUF2764 family protein [Bacteroidales bacterium]MBR1783071.1 DUF2764 family protein [Bacteroidales bacterium]
MSNFEYIIASLPYLTVDYKYEEGQGFYTVLEEIRRDLSEKDNAALDVLLDGFDAQKLGPEFYAAAFKSSEKFLREYFRFDLMLRNAKVRYLNRELGRPEETDVVNPWNEDEGEEAPQWEFEEQRPIQLALEGASLLDREKQLDDITWKKIASLETFHYFDLTAVLAYVAKLHIVDRWLALDEEKGRELFHKLVQEVKGTFAGVNYQGKEENR